MLEKELAISLIPAIPYSGTVILTLSALIKSRKRLHLYRVIGLFLWLAYGLVLENNALIITNILGIILEGIAAHKN